MFDWLWALCGQNGAQALQQKPNRSKLLVNSRFFDFSALGPPVPPGAKMVFNENQWKTKENQWKSMKINENQWKTP